MAKFTAVLHVEDDMYIATCPEIGTVSQGSTVDEAVSNLREATSLYLEETQAQDIRRPIVKTFEVGEDVRA